MLTRVARGGPRAELWVKCRQSGFINVMGAYRDVSVSFRMLAGGYRGLIWLETLLDMLNVYHVYIYTSTTLCVYICVCILVLEATLFNLFHSYNHMLCGRTFLCGITSTS